MAFGNLLFLSLQPCNPNLGCLQPVQDSGKGEGLIYRLLVIYCVTVDLLFVFLGTACYAELFFYPICERLILRILPAQGIIACFLLLAMARVSLRRHPSYGGDAGVVYTLHRSKTYPLRVVSADLCNCFTHIK